MRTLTHTECKAAGHCSIHHPGHDKGFCGYCVSWVLLDGDNCVCCQRQLKPQTTKKYARAQRVLERGIEQYHYLVECIHEHPTARPVSIWIKDKQITYSIPLRCLEIYAYGPAKNCTKPEKAAIRKHGLIHWLTTEIKAVGMF